MERAGCPTCGASITSVDRFCHSCGASLLDTTPALPGDPMPAPPSSATDPPPHILASPELVHGYGRAPIWSKLPAVFPLSNQSGDAPAGVQPLLEFDVDYPDRLSRPLIFVKWLLILPHLLVLALLGIGLSVVSVLAGFAILFTGRYPRGLWTFSVDTLRWAANATAYQNLARDEYPPFSGTDPYPVRFQLDYPDRMSRLLIFVKWLLIIPHLLIFYVLGVVAGVVLVVAWFAILFIGRMPRGLHDFMTGYSRWTYRVATYALLLTDAYPPFTMDHVPSPTRPPWRSAVPT